MSENNNICLGRAAIPVVALNLGYRVVDLYDNTCSKLDEPFLIVRSNKILWIKFLDLFYIIDILLNL